MSAQATDLATVHARTDGLALAVQGLEPESAMALRSCFEEMFSSAEKWAASARLIVVTSPDQKREMKMARESRLALREIRVKAEHARKRLKEDSTRRGKAIDGIANVLKALIEPIEEHLLEQETFAERAEDVRKDALRSAREEALRALGADPAAYANLGETSEETWAITLEGAKDAKTAREEAAKQAEAVRLEAERLAAEARKAAKAEAARLEAERVERERLAAEENARLRAEAAEREAAASAERVRVEAERAAERAKTDEAAALAKAEKDRELAAMAAETQKAREATDKAARELAKAQAEAAQSRAEAEKATAERVAADAARASAEVAARQAAEMAPDREKLAAFATMLRGLSIPVLTTPTGKAAAAKVAEQIEKMATWVAKTGAAL